MLEVYLCLTEQLKKNVSKLQSTMYNLSLVLLCKELCWEMPQILKADRSSFKYNFILNVLLSLHLLHPQVKMFSFYPGSRMPGRKKSYGNVHFC